jgi:rubredoxin
MLKTKTKYRCIFCGYVYDPEKGDPNHGIFKDRISRFFPRSGGVPNAMPEKKGLSGLEAL